MINFTDKCIDLHSHSSFSDGLLSVEELTELAISNNVQILAITDHNYINRNFDQLKSKFRNRIQLVNGVEISTVFQGIEVHVIALGISQSDYSILGSIVEGNISAEVEGERDYVEAIRKNLSKFNIDLPDYAIIKAYFNSDRVGMSELISFMTENGFCRNVPEALNYIGLYGERLAYANRAEFVKYVSMEEAVNAILRCKNAIPVLCHPLSYKIDERASQSLVEVFKSCTDTTPAALEVFYGNYSSGDFEFLKKLCRRYDLLYSGGSDFHGTYDRNRLSKLKLSEIDCDKHVVSHLELL